MTIKTSGEKVEVKLEIDGDEVTKTLIDNDHEHPEDPPDLGFLDDLENLQNEENLDLDYATEDDIALDEEIGQDQSEEDYEPIKPIKPKKTKNKTKVKKEVGEKKIVEKKVDLTEDKDTQCFYCGEMIHMSNIREHMKETHGNYSGRMHGEPRYDFHIYFWGL